MKVKKKKIRKMVKDRMGTFDLRGVRKSTGSRPRQRVSLKLVKWKPENFSIAKYCRSAFENNWRNARYEKKMFYKTRKIAMSKAVISSQAMVTGGVLIPPEYSMDLQQNLRARAVVRGQNPAIFNMQGDTLILPKKTGSTSLYWVAEGVDFDSGSYQTEPTFGDNMLVLKEAIAISKISNNTIQDGGQAADDIVRQDLVETAALGEDLAFLSGKGGTEPLGIFNHSGVTTTTLATNGAYLSYDDLMDAMYSIEVANGICTGWLWHPRVKNGLRQLKDGNGKYLLELGNIEKGNQDMLLGLPVKWSTQISIAQTVGTATTCTSGILANFRKIAIGQKQSGPEIVATNVGGSSWNYNETHFRLCLRVDLRIRENAEVAIIAGVL